MRQEPMLPVLHEEEPAVFLDCSMNPLDRKVVTAEWEHLCRAIFGEARGDGQMKWTGNSYRYDIFTKGQDGKIALRWRNGGGEGWFVYNERQNVVNILRMIASLEDENRRWDACHYLWETAENLARWRAQEK